MKKPFLTLLFLLLYPIAVSDFAGEIVAENHIYSQHIKTLQAIANNNWLSSPAVLRLRSDDVLYVSFDELSHTYHRYTYHIERCEADWTTASEVFESDWIEGFNNCLIENYSLSVNTIVPYTHYQFQIPNDRCRLKMSGNYRLHITDDDSNEEVASIDFLVTEQTMSLALEATTNTDIDTNQSHQQLSLRLNYLGNRVTYPDEQIMLVVMQNGREDNMRRGVPPTYSNADGLEWHHCRELIFEGGNEYRKFEILDPSHPTMGIDNITWDGSNYQVYPFLDEPRPNYIYDKDANGAFYIRNSDNRENDTSSEYVLVNYRLKAPYMPQGHIIINGHWTTEASNSYIMTYDKENSTYTAQILQKQGYYSYQYLWKPNNGRPRLLPSEGNFYQTENRYLAFIYYKGIGERTWRLTALREILLGSSDAHDKTWR